MAQDDKPTPETTSTAPTSTAATSASTGADDPVSLIEDNIVRRLVRVAVHVRGYAPYYAATVAFGVMLLVVPALGGGDNDGDAVAAGVTRGTDTSTTTQPTTTTPRSSAAPAELATSAGDFFTPPVSTEATRSSDRPTYSFDDFDTSDDSDAPASSETDDADKPCTVEPPDGAPVSPVSPEKEADNAQNTLEAATGQDAPAEADETVGDGLEATGQCDDDGTDAESVPDPTETPTTPASTDTPTVDDDVVIDLAGSMFVI